MSSTASGRSDAATPAWAEHNDGATDQAHRTVLLWDWPEGLLGELTG